jgi:hypothetical protein
MPELTKAERERVREWDAGHHDGVNGHTCAHMDRPDYLDGFKNGDSWRRMREIEDVGNGNATQVFRA